MKSIRLLLLTGLLTIGLVGCMAALDNETASESQNQQAGRLTITGSSTIAPLAADVAKRFESRHRGIRIDVQTGGSGKGIADVRMGVADIGMVSRPLMADEDDLLTHPFAADGVGLIVHESNPIRELSADQIIKIYTDHINNWRDLGGQDQEITVVHKAEGRATLEVFLKHFGIDNLLVKGDVIVGENEHAVKTVAGTQGAIGYVSIGTAEADIEAGVPIRLLPLDGIDATTANVASGAFPMSRPLHLVTLGSSSPLAGEFIRFCQSAEVHDLVKSHYYVPLERESGVAK
ncbi:MAG: phosphate ABC transporter substrate-binding protein [Planctomycetaceae bacterium]